MLVLKQSSKAEACFRTMLDPGRHDVSMRTQRTKCAATSGYELAWKRRLAWEQGDQLIRYPTQNKLPASLERPNKPMWMSSSCLAVDLIVLRIVTLTVWWLRGKAVHFLNTLGFVVVRQYFVKTFQEMREWKGRSQYLNSSPRFPCWQTSQSQFVRDYDGAGIQCALGQHTKMISAFVFDSPSAGIVPSEDCFQKACFC